MSQLNMMQNTRVVLQLWDSKRTAEEAENADSHNNNNMSTSGIWEQNLNEISSNSTSGQLNGEVHQIDCKTVQVDLSEESIDPPTHIKHRMTFDYVSHPQWNCLETELATLMDVMMFQQQNICMVRFAPRRGDYITFLYNVFVKQVNQRLQQLNATIRGIKVNYTDMWSRSTQAVVEQFHCTRELLVWLLNNHRHIEHCRQACSKPSLQEKFEIELQFVQEQQENVVKVKFFLINVFLDKMDSDARKKWHLYMDQLGGSVSAAEFDFEHSILTNCLRRYFESSVNQRILLFFDIPTEWYKSVTGIGVSSLDMLQMAHVVVLNRHKQHLRKCGNLLKRSSLALYEVPQISSTTENSATSVAVSNVLQPSVSFTIPFKADERLHKRRRFSLQPQVGEQDGYSKKDFNSLITWYRKIDEKYAAARDDLKKNYDQLYDSKISHMCTDINNISRTINYADSTVENELLNIVNDESETQEIYNKIKAAIGVFQQLSYDIESLSCSEILKVYLKTKSFEMSQYVVKLKIEQLQSGQQRLSGAFTEEISTLKSMLFHDSAN